jgi:hypothetical protein
MFTGEAGQVGQIVHGLPHIFSDPASDDRPAMTVQ